MRGHLVVVWCAVMLCIDAHAQQIKTSQSSSFPVVSAATQKDRDDTRKQILLDELQTEKDKLAESQRQLNGAITTKQPQSEIARLQDVTRRHEADIQALNNEIAAMATRPFQQTARAAVPAKKQIVQGRSTSNRMSACANGWQCKSSTQNPMQLVVAATQSTRCTNGWGCSNGVTESTK